MVNKKVYCIAEIGINHNGDIELAKKLIDMSADADCDAVKFQKRTIEDVYTPEELDKPRESPWGTTNRQQKEGLEFSIKQYQELELYTRGKNLDFIMSCWDLNSLKEIEDNLNVKYHKVASAMLTDRAFLEALNKTGKPVILSTGLSSSDEINKAITVLDNVTHVLACTSTYPTKAEEVNLNHVLTLKKQYPNLSVGFSNHYSGLLACFGATTLGAEMLEFHVTKDRTMYGSDQAASIEKVHDLMQGVRQLEKMIGDGVKTVYEDEKPIIKKLRKTNTL